MTDQTWNPFRDQLAYQWTVRQRASLDGLPDDEYIYLHTHGKEQ
ncbi:MAG TPA: hypothetical protein VGD15_08865 [Kribbella sp.]|jgi:hypothetical protein